MQGMTHDMRTGLGFALLSAVTFGFSGTLASPLLDAGWSPAAVVIIRIAVASTVLAVPAAIALRGRWHLLRDNARLVAAYGCIVVAFTQFSYYSSVAHMDVAVALLIEYVAPVVVLGWLWARHGQRPSRLTALGAVLAVVGLVLVLDLFSGADVSLVGIAWGLAAMLGCAVYFVLSAHPATLPPLALAAGGMVVGGTVLSLAALLGLLELRAATSWVSYGGLAVPWWVPLLLVGIVSTAFAYICGIEAGRRLGSRLSSFAALLEVVAALAVAWVLLGEAPAPVQALGGLGILAGVVLVKLGEPAGETLVSEAPVAPPVAA
ncbi:EamA family transporter [Nocardioides jiangxiensis]|uniref:DMT family transporter n=1 Tax=Nocardioides jiangxiensis TaxID=3064524 RepID=A0ABT9AY89_9ACTN|nr:DMT family transporter [Nocardioides sp. WY-20]MDO7867293.1 DMT family transporter [Nocardioides sp. WY-20]